jgi:chromosome segregation protein
MLSALELNGFKSFADRTRFDFLPGITVVVGPNGSGKSNVVDAIKWVLGSQSVKSLRGKEMTDVIFSGSRSRRQAGAAEASLFFDNSKRLLNHDAAEVQITRRVYRSGEGEYLINRQPCRLRDVRDLLGTAGGAASAYSIIEQGKVDAVLQSSPKERRLLFEEAAGVSRFRVKREEAAKRLLRVRENLLRLADIVGELDARLRTVRSQAGKAQRYTELTKRLEQLRTQLALEDWRRQSERIDALQTAVHDDRDEAVGLQQRLTECDARIAEIDRDAAALQQQLRESAAAETAVRERLAQCESTRGSHLARIDELDQEVQRLARQLLTLTTRAGDSQQLVIDTTAELKAAETLYAKLVDQVDQRRYELEGAESQHADVVEKLAAERKTLDQWTNEASRVRGESQLLLARLQSAEVELARLDDAAAPMEQSRERLAADNKRAAAALAELATALNTAAEELHSAQTELALDRSRLTALHKRTADLEGRLTGARERTIVLEELERRLEGLTSGAKEVLRRAREEPDGPFRHVRGVVADLLHVDADSAPLVEIALGDRANYLVVTETESLAPALAAEPSSWPGRTSFLRLDVPTPASAVDRVDLTGEPGVMGRADTFVEAAVELDSMVRRLLGRHWLVDTLATALRLAGGPGRGLNFITVAGEALFADGTLTVGPRQSIAGLLSRRSELRALREKIEEMERAAADDRRDCQRLEERIAACDAAVQELARRHSAAVHSHNETRLHAASVGDKLEQIQQQLADIAAARAAAAGQFAQLADERDRCDARVQELGALAAACQAAMAEQTQRQTEWETLLTELRQIVADERVQLARSEQRLDGLKRQMEQLLRDHAERGSLLDQTKSRAEECLAQKARLHQSTLELATELAELYRSKDQYAAQAAEMAARHAEQHRERVAAVTAGDAVRSELQARQRQMQAVELELQQLTQQRAHMAQRIYEDYRIDVAALAADPAAVSTLAASKGKPPASRDMVEQEIRELRERLQDAGPVNLESLTELEALETRHGDLAGQYRDLEEARSRLEQIVQQINAQSRQLFTATVDDVRTHFREIFAGLFAGGEADILLEEDASGDVLECGVSIIARPPGKQPRSISLLSGGERTLTCVALLLAIFRSRPSPFCVLDEVDAALDEANIDRFVGVLKQFMESTQFIVITHSKRTMTCSDTLYGVTMQESGVSKRVSVRFEDVSEDGHIRSQTLRAA